MELASEAPSASIQLHMCDLHGTIFPVELFRADLPVHNSDQMSHIFGIRDLNPSSHEARIDASTSGPASASTSVTEKLESTNDPAVTMKEYSKKNSGAPSDSSSSSASSSCPSVAHQTPLPECEEIRVDFDALSERFTVRRLEIKFVRQNPSSRSKKLELPELQDWVIEPSFSLFKEWVQEQLNGLAIGNSQEKKSVRTRLLASKDHFLHAESACLEFAMEGDEKDSCRSQSSCDSDDDDRVLDKQGSDSEDALSSAMLVALRLQDLHQLSASARKRKQSCRPLEELPAIQENFC